MTRDLKKSKDGLEQANISLEQRRKYMENCFAAMFRQEFILQTEMVNDNDVKPRTEKMFDITTEKVLFSKFTVIC